METCCCGWLKNLISSCRHVAGLPHTSVLAKVACTPEPKSNRLDCRRAPGLESRPSKQPFDHQSDHFLEPICGSGQKSTYEPLGTDMIEMVNAAPFSGGKPRCSWPGTDPLYLAYHDAEWGVPECGDRALYEKLVLDGFQAGLSWITVLRKREAFRAAFDNFEPEKIARYNSRKIESLMQNPGIIRNRAKIEGTVASARAWLKIQETGGFANYLWGFFNGRSVQNNYCEMSEIPAQTPLSVRIAKDLKSRGFRFCGPTVVYAFCQATGMVNDHLVHCFRHEECRAFQRAGAKLRI
jgi:DNA-3-methyladenine glycosylase I